MGWIDITNKVRGMYSEAEISNHPVAVTALSISVGRVKNFYRRVP